jgi:NosR/NirI family transcriptional regulator, nitrous oxide reductase regulator
MNRNMSLKIVRAARAALAALPSAAAASSRFPKPQFDTDYTAPAVPNLLPDFAVTPLADVLLLTGALAVAVVLVRRVRLRRWILLFGLLCLWWFGFVRNGCFCPVGAIQNVAGALAGRGAVPVAVALFFALPLIFALLYGRVFCSVVCPLGALQEFFIVKPLRMPRALDAVLRIVPLMVLCLGVVCVVNGAGYIICRTDPFVGIFRQSAALPMLLAGMGVLLVGTVVARPYCRYFCPYGVLLEFCSRIAWKRVEIADSECVNCRLCVGVCPVDAVEAPRPALSDKVRGRQFRQFLTLLVLLPLFVVGGGGAGYLSGAGIAGLHPGVMLVENWRGTPEADHDLYPAIEDFKRGGGNLESAEQRAAEIIVDFRRHSLLAGALIGLVLGLRLLALSRLPGLSLHQASRTRCVACGRCFGVCPAK